MNKFKHLIITAFLGGFFMSNSVADHLPPPKDMTAKRLYFEIHCVPSFKRMIEVLEEHHGEAPVVIGHQSQAIMFALFVNEDLSTSSIVISRKTPGNNETCVFSKGKSAPGESFILPADIIFPEGPHKGIKGTNT